MYKDCIIYRKKILHTKIYVGTGNCSDRNLSASPLAIASLQESYAASISRMQASKAGIFLRVDGWMLAGWLFVWWEAIAYCRFLHDISKVTPNFMKEKSRHGWVITNIRCAQFSNERSKFARFRHHRIQESFQIIPNLHMGSGKTLDMCVSTNWPVTCQHHAWITPRPWIVISKKRNRWYILIIMVPSLTWKYRSWLGSSNFAFESCFVRESKSASPWNLGPAISKVGSWSTWRKIRRPWSEGDLRQKCYTDTRTCWGP